MAVKPYYSDSLATIYLGDWRGFSEVLGQAQVAVTDPPYGIKYRSNSRRVSMARSIAGDLDTSERDDFLEAWGNRSALVFGSWRRPRPAETKMLLVWDTKGALGMGDTDLPWKPAHQEIYVLGREFLGARTSDVMRFAPVQSMASNGRLPPHEKPVSLMRALVRKCLPFYCMLDPFMGSGTTLVAAKSELRTVIGIEIEERYCEIAAQRLSQEVLDLGGVA